MKHLKKMTAMMLAILFVLSPLMGVPVEFAFASEPITVSTTTDKTETDLGTVTLSLVLSEKIETKAFALDFRSAYDHDVFEWVEGAWSSELDFSAMTHIDLENEVAAILSQTAITVEGEIFTFTLRVKDGVACGTESEVEVAVSGIDGAVTEGVAVTVGHYYEHHCDTECKNCDYVRQDAAHVYTDACDGVCNDCGSERTPPHSYDHEGDESCNLCGEKRTVEYELITAVSPLEAEVGGQVTVTVSLSKTRTTRSFALDFLSAYNHDVFEWVEGDWSESLKALGGLYDVNAGSEAVFVSTEAIDVPAGEVFRFVLRVKTDASCLKPYELKVGAGSIPNLTLTGTSLSLIHTYSSDCDPRCDRCNLARTPLEDHTYDNACDDDCNLCGTTRIVGDHVYEYPCATTCTVCGAVRADSPHTYDDQWDDFCNVCGEQRVVLRDLTSTLTADTACVGEEITVQISLSAPLTTTAAGLDFSEAYDHDVFEWVDGYWSGTVSFAAFTEVNPGVDAIFLSSSEITLEGLVFTMVLRVKDTASCTASYPIKATASGFRNPTYVGDALEVVHGYDNACDADCNACGATRVPADHVYTDACDTDCDVCGAVRTVPHSYDNACDADCNVCGAIRVPADHVYTSDSDDSCNVCGYIRPLARDLTTALSVSEAGFGDAFTVTVSLDKTATVQSLSLDLLTSYDHDVFEWVSGSWSSAVTGKAALADVQPGDAAVFLASTAFEVSGEIFSFTLRVKSGDFCENAYEIKVPLSGLESVTLIGDTLTIGHVYDHDCDTDCNGCGALRTVEGHAYDHDGDESCNKCGALRLAFFGTSLSLQHNFAINYKVKKTLLDQFTDFRLVVEMNDRTVEICEYTTDSNYLSFRFEDIAPQAIGDAVRATLYAKEDGVEKASKTYEFGVRDYCHRALEIYSADSYATFRTLIVDLLRYGAKAQVYTNYKLGSMVDADLTAQQLAWGTQGDPTLENHFVYDFATIENPTAQWYGAGLVLDSAVTLKLKFKADSVDGVKVRIAIENGSTVEIPSEYFHFNSSDGLYYLYVNGLNADQMSRKLELTVCASDGTALSNTVQYSIESYAYEKQNSTIAGLADLVKAMMNYGNAAKAYSKA